MPQRNAIHRIRDTTDRKISEIDFETLQPHEDEHLRWTDVSSIEFDVLSMNRGITLPPYVAYYDDAEVNDEKLSLFSEFRDAWFDLRALLPARPQSVQNGRRRTMR